MRRPNRGTGSAGPKRPGVGKVWNYFKNIG